MGAGVTLAVLGAILTFAIRADPKGISLPVLGIILMIAGAGLIFNARRSARRKRVVTRLEQTDPNAPPRVVRETIREVDDE